MSIDNNTYASIYKEMEALANERRILGERALFITNELDALYVQRRRTTRESAALALLKEERALQLQRHQIHERSLEIMTRLEVLGNELHMMRGADIEYSTEDVLYSSH